MCVSGGLLQAQAEFEQFERPQNLLTGGELKHRLPTGVGRSFDTRLRGGVHAGTSAPVRFDVTVV